MEIHSAGHEPLLTNDEKIIHKPRNKRRELLNVDYQSWPLSLKQNVICGLKIDIEEDLWNELYEIAKTLDYEKVHNVLNVCLWPKCEATKKMKEKLSIFKDDIEKSVLMKTNPGENVYPHRDLVRGKSLYLPLGPKGDDYAPLEIYYNNMEYGLPENNKPKIWCWNTKCTHAVFNKLHARYNMQASINLSYTEVFKKYNEIFDL